MSYTTLYRGWILGRGATPSKQHIQIIRKGLYLNGVYSIRRVPSAGKYSLTLQPLWKKDVLFPPLLGWSPYMAQQFFPLFSYAIQPNDKIITMTDIPTNPYRIHYGDWSMVANFPSDWYPGSDDLAIIPHVEKIESLRYV
jgi:hypothetical protein